MGSGDFGRGGEAPTL